MAQYAIISRSTVAEANLNIGDLRLDVDLKVLAWSGTVWYAVADKALLDGSETDEHSHAGGGDHPDLATHEALGLLGSLDAFAQVDHDALANPHHPNANDHANTLDHAEAHTPESHTDQTATAAELNEVVGGGETALHSHAGGGGGDPKLDSWPIGSVFLAVISTSPATLLGGGTWERIAEGRMLIGQNDADVDFDTAEETGGAKTKTLAETEIPSHVHGELAPSSASGGALKFAVDSNANGSQASGLNTEAVGGGQAFSLMNPFLVCYIWKRTA